MIRSSVPRRLAAPAALLLLVLAPAALRAQVDTVTVVAGAQFRAGNFKRALLGRDYRDLWTTPFRVPLLDLAQFAGGLQVEQRGGGQQTRSLRLLGADGREYVFRSVQKYPELPTEPALQGTVIARLIRDQVSSLHPASALVAAALLEAAGVLHVTPVLRVMPDDPALGEFRAEFAGMLGLLEERPDEAGDEGDADRALFGGFERITGTERLLERLEEEPDDRVDSRAYLRARLTDLFLGDWDRHADQWRWGESEGPGGTDLWVPIPRDRDYAFVNYDGFLLGLLRSFVPNAVKFGPELENVYGLTLNAQSLDRLFLAELPREVWDSIAVDLQGRLTDEVIEAATLRMPPEFQPLSAARLAATLRSRRDDLRVAAVRYYELTAGDVDVYATDADELARVDRLPGERTEVRIHERDEDTGEVRNEPYFHRVFEADETREVRLYLRGGDDSAVVSGDARPGSGIRIIGGGGDDVLVDSTSARAGGRTAFYDDRGDNRFVRGPSTIVSTREYEAPEVGSGLSGQGFRDWGYSRGTQPYFDYRSTEGVIVGGGPVLTRYGFRQVPYAYRLGARGMVALRSWGVAADAFGDFRRVNSPVGLSFYARASQLESFRFFGFGNDTPELADDLTRVPQDELLLSAALSLPLVRGGRIAAGPVLKYTDPEIRPGGPLDAARPLGSGALGQVGAQLEAEVDRRDSALLPRRGFRIAGTGAAYPAAWDLASAFGRAGLEAATYLGLPVFLEPTLALRLGAERVWGEFPVHEAAFLGGSRSLRGYGYQRFAGDALVSGSAELRAPLTRAKLLVRGDLGGLLLADAGRVYYDGESDGGWHSALGAGLWFGFALRGQQTVVSATFASGESGAVYLKLGMPF